MCRKYLGNQVGLFAKVGFAVAVLVTSSCRLSNKCDAASVPVKSLEQLQKEFLDLKFGMFLHFNMETYKEVQWLAGYHSAAVFNPEVETIDTDAWADAAKAAGMTYGVLTVKHTAGFCLWDSKYTTYDIMNGDCPYKKDLVAQFVKSFTSHGLKAGLYYCWRHPGFGGPNGYKVYPPECDPSTHSMEEQNEFAKKQIAELLTNYPDVFYIWNDALDPVILPEEKIIPDLRSLGKNVIFSANWWEGAKKGHHYTDIAVTETRHFPEDNKLPGETCWTLENSWFWYKTFKPKKAADIAKAVIEANSRNANLLLNVGADKQGRFCKESIETLKEVGRILKSNQTSTKVR